MEIDGAGRGGEEPVIADEDGVRLARYLAGECSPAERAAIEGWITESPDRAAAVDEVRGTWDAARRAPLSWDTAAAWEAVRARRDHASTSRQHRPRRPMSVPRLRASRGWDGGGWRWTAVAASIVVAVGVGLALALGRASRPSRPLRAAHVYATRAGHRLAITLSDKTTVILAPDSRLSVPSNYGVPTRTLALVGEALFDVVHDPTTPFTVTAGNAVTTDVGTSFDVRAYPGDRTVRVAVRGGRIALTAPNGPTAFRSVEAGPRDLTVVDSSGAISLSHNIDVSRYTAWASGTLVFRDTPLGDVLPDFGRWYDLELTVTDPVLAGRRVTARWSAERSSQALFELAGLLHARATRHGRVVLLSPLPEP